MSKNLYPLVYKPGIKRDGTLFQADYCTEGQWIRFQRGNIRKMGGMKGINGDFIIDLRRVTNIRVTPSVGNDNNMIVYIAHTRGVLRNIITPDFNLIASSHATGGININDPNLIWVSEIIIQGANRLIVFLSSPTRNNINNNDDCSLYSGTIDANFTLRPLASNPNLSGLSGLLFINPFLFVYGSNGLVQWSTSQNPLSFTNVADHQIFISNDKIICGKAIRGGINSPVILFWTLTSVIRIINKSTDSATLSFDKDVLSRSSSILSSRCVVEYDGLFFWPGTNRFFLYNGLVQEIPNTLSLNFFYENLDMNYRQLIIGEKNTLYGEIWWFFPMKGQDANVGIINNHVLIYNIRENCWYDTSLSRETAFYSEDYGFLSSYGTSLTNNAAPLSLYRHEYETAFNDVNGITEQVPQLGQAGLDFNPIESFFTTPTISWAAFNPLKQLTGVDRWMYSVTLEPDFTLMPPPDPAHGDLFGTDMTVVINSKEYAQDVGTISPAFRIVAPLVPGMDPRLAKIDMAIQGRHITFTFTTTKNFEVGHIMILLGLGDGQ